MPKEAVVFLLLDAFRWDYLSTEGTPRLSELASSGVYCRKLISTAGFTQRSAIFTGAFPDVTGNFTMYCYDPDGSPYGFLRPFRQLFSSTYRVQAFLPPWAREPLSKAMRYPIRRKLLRRLSKKKAAHASTAYIPLDMLHLIGVTEDKRPIYSDGALGVQTIFDVARQHDTPFEYLMFPVALGDDDRVIDAALKAAGRAESRFYLSQLSDPDFVGHRFGPNSTQRRQMAADIDRRFERLRTAFEASFSCVSWVLIGDHGMTDVVSSIDAIRPFQVAARSAGLQHGVDFLIFNDSTMCRIWFLSDRARSLRAVFDQEEFRSKGRIIDDALSMAHHLPLPDRRYGDVIWWANNGVLILPDYFHAPGTVVRGMHGYDSYEDDSKGFAIIATKGVGQKEIDEGQLVDICPTLCDLLSLPYPEQNVGRSLL